MKITNNKHTQPKFNGRLKSINALNPISYYTNRYMKKSARLSQTHIQKIIPELEGKIKIVDIKKGKNLKISAWDINPKNSDSYVIFLHGMAQNISEYQQLYKTILEKKLGVFAVEYRGYGSNPKSTLSENKLRKDIESAYEYLTKNKKIKPQNIILIGHSMGGALATNFATKHKDLKALILICPIYNVQNLGKKFMTHKKIGEGIPNYIMKLTECIKPLAWLHSLRFSTGRKIEHVKTPTYLLQSTNDSVTTIDNAKIIASKTKKSNILEDFAIFETGGHKVDNQKIQKIAEYLDLINNHNT